MLLATGPTRSERHKMAKHVSNALMSLSQAADALEAPQIRPRVRFGRLIGASPVMCKPSRTMNTPAICTKPN